MALTLYHGEPAANSLKVLLGIKEKGVPFESRVMNLHRFEQHEDWFKAINPMGQVPVLVHDGKVINESTVINEYIDEVFEGPALRPSDPFLKAKMRIWTKFVDEYFCPALSFIGWHHMIKNITDKLTPEEFEEKLARIPLKEQQDKWRTSSKQGYTPEQLENWGRQVKASLDRMERQLAETQWLVGDQYTLADVSCFAMCFAMPTRSPHLLAERPNVSRWHAAAAAREGTKAALGMPNPVRETLEASREGIASTLR